MWLGGDYFEVYPPGRLATCCLCSGQRPVSRVQQQLQWPDAGFGQILFQVQGRVFAHRRSLFAVHKYRDCKILHESEICT